MILWVNESVCGGGGWEERELELEDCPAAFIWEKIVGNNKYW